MDWKPKPGDWVVVLKWAVVWEGLTAPYVGLVLAVNDMYWGGICVAIPGVDDGEAWVPAGDCRPATPEEASQAHLASLEGL